MTNPGGKDRGSRRDSGALEDLLPRVFDAAPCAMIAVDRRYRLLAMNARARAVFGVASEDVSGRDAQAVLGLAFGGRSCPWRRVMDTGTAVGEVGLRPGKGAADTGLTAAIAPLDDRAGRRAGCIAVLGDRAVPAVDAGDPSGPFRDILTGDPTMKQLFAVLPTMARSASSILVLGETGTGKNLIARTVHRLSARADGPFITVNCAALPETLLESELFGYRAGAFTGAHRDKPGRFAAAEGGTLFLDEIGDIPLAMQVKLLRVLQERVYEQLGDPTPIRCDVRIITATHRDLGAMVAEGTFRRDLFYRINVLTVDIPPLRDRKGDIPLLAEAFVNRLSATRHKPITGVSSAALELLMQHHYPGNVRELENILEHAWVLCRERVIDVRHLPRGLQLLAAAGRREGAQGLQALESTYLLRVLQRHGWHRGKAAAELGVHRTTLQRRIKRLGLEPPPVDGRHRPDSH